MASPYSMDLRQRVIEAVEGGLSCNQAAARFEVAISTAIGWVNRYRETGSFAPDRMGGHRPIAAIAGLMATASVAQVDAETVTFQAGGYTEPARPWTFS